jgi:NAD(P)-dependent dehydrogenase (short-subunit alcohol dehydrogenase family)
MKIVVIGATGIIGASVARALESRHQVVRAARGGPIKIDMADRRSIADLFASVSDIDAVVCCAASVPLAPLRSLSDEDFETSLRGKLLGQVSLARHALAHLRDGGSITLTSGMIPPMQGATAGALANAGLEAFVRAASMEMPRGIRINVVCPGWVKETLTRLGMDSAQGTAASDVARAYVECVEGSLQGQTVRPTTE